MQDFKIHTYMTIIGQTNYQLNTLFPSYQASILCRPNPLHPVYATKVEEKLLSLPYFDQSPTALVLMIISKKELPYTYFCCLHGHAWLKGMGMQSMHADIMGNKLCLTSIVCLTNDGQWSCMYGS